MTLLVGKEKVKFNLYQIIKHTDEEKNYCMWIESSLLPFEEKAPKILQEETLEGYKLKTNSFTTKELDFELTSLILDVEKLILMSDGDEDGVLATIDEVPNQSSRTSPMSLVGL